MTTQAVNIFLDIETTDRIKDNEIPDVVEIAFYEENDLYKYVEFVKPQEKISQSAFYIHKINESDVANARDFKDVWTTFENKVIK